MNRWLLPIGLPALLASLLFAALAADRSWAGSAAQEPPRDADSTPLIDRITPEMINRIRFMELRAARAKRQDNPEQLVDRVSVQISPETVNKFLVLKQGDFSFRGDAARKRFLAMTPAQKLAVIAWWVRDTNDEFQFADDVRIQRDPEILVDFRKRIQPTLLANCASAACHGSLDPSNKFRLFNDPKRRDQMTYANFLTLRQWLVNDQPLINRDKPDDSLLLTYVLPESESRHPHPRTADFRPLYQKRAARGYRNLHDWIASLRLLKPGVGYGFNALSGFPNPTSAPDDNQPPEPAP